MGMVIVGLGYVAASLWIALTGDPFKSWVLLALGFLLLDSAERRRRETKKSDKK